ncbi:tripartite motif containing 101 isoform X1 [Astyanax mexicanus]|uniref:tripartite motif containing 101 isoform X1 n=1 Tax=Astyanax mexicanus TaxID=7994 RepID=UPI0020CAA257|nr:tripartite motif containing 101 isoform X1 [Astyanax mexicanus]
MSLPLDLSSFTRDASLETLEKQLICPICLEVFTKPVVILPCQHNLCRKCANELYLPSLLQVGFGGRFRCPSCRHDVVLDRHGVYGLPRNLLVENIIDVYKQESASSRPPPKPLAQITCEQHEGEKLNIYCITCQLPTCSLCKVFGAHSTCQVAPIPEVYQQQKTELSNGLGCLVATNENIQAFINDLEELCRNIEENGKNQTQVLCEKFDRMSAILEERRKIMVQEITYEQDEKIGWTRSLVQTYSEHVDTNSKLMKTAFSAMEEPEMAAFLQDSKSLIEQVSEAAKCTPMETLVPGYENMDHYKVDFNAEERALYQLDFLQPEDEVEEDPEEPEEPESDPETQLETEPEMEPEPEPEPRHSPVQNPEMAQDLRPESLAINSAEPQKKEDTHAHAEAKNDTLCEKNGLSTLQKGQPEFGCEELDAGGLRNQSVPVQADEETKLYPSWYKPHREMLSPNLALSFDAMGARGHEPQLVKDPSVQSPLQQFQTPLSMWLSSSGFIPVATENLENPERSHSGKDSPDSVQGQVTEAEKPVTELGADESARKEGMTSLSLQTITLVFYLLTFLVILQRVWGSIQCILNT